MLCISYQAWYIHPRASLDHQLPDHMHDDITDFVMKMISTSMLNGECCLHEVLLYDNSLIRESNDCPAT